VNESCTYLMKLIHEIGLELRSSAVCTGLRRLRYGHFTLTHALLMKHCDTQSIAENIEFCRPVVNQVKHTRIIQTDRQDDQIDLMRPDDDDDDGLDHHTLHT